MGKLVKRDYKAGDEVGEVEQSFDEKSFNVVREIRDLMAYILERIKTNEAANETFRQQVRDEIRLTRDEIGQSLKVLRSKEEQIKSDLDRVRSEEDRLKRELAALDEDKVR